MNMPEMVYGLQMMMAQVAYITEKHAPKIHPRPVWPVFEDTKIMTWKDYATCRL